MRFHRLPSLNSSLLRTAALTLGLGVAGEVGLMACAQAQAAPSATAPSPETAEVQRLIRDGQYTPALKLIDDALARNPKDPQMRFRRGVALSMMDRKPEALTVFQKLVEDHPDMPSPYNNMAVIYGSMGEYDKAREALDKAIRTNPAYATAYQNLGDVYAQLASQAYNKALQLDKTDTTVQPKLALLKELTSGPNAAPPATSSKRGSSATTGATPAPVVAGSLPTAAVPAVAAVPATPTAVAAAKPTKPAVEAPALVAKPEAARTEPAKVDVPAAAKPAAEATASAPAAKPAAADGVADVERAVQSWASAWSRRDMNAYYAAYAPEFKGQANSRKAWEQDRHDRIATRKKIRVEISELKIRVDGNTAVARFRQTYSSDTLSTNGRKTLELQRSNRGKWQIKQESVGS